MKQNFHIERTALNICPIGLGTVGAGLDWDGAEADQIFDAYLDLGGNLIDTAHVYSDWIKPEKARSERVVGDWIGRSGKREKVILMTKGGHPDMTVKNPDTHRSRMKKRDMIDDLHDSLKKLQTEYIDIYFYHRDDMQQSVPALVEVMQDFVRAGKIRYYGCSNWKAARMQEADAYCREKGYDGFVANQSLLNIGLKHMNPLEDDTMEAFDEAMFLYHKKNSGNIAMPYMGVCSGFFHLYIDKGAEAVKTSPYYTNGNIKVAENVKILMQKYNASVSQVLLGFFFAQDFPCAPLYGPQDATQLKDAMDTLSISFQKEDFCL